MATDTLELVSFFRTQASINVASLAVLTFNNIITFEQEVTLIWQGSRSFMTLLFFLFRYTAFPGIIVTIIYDYFDVDASASKDCAALLGTGTVLLMMNMAYAECMLIMRTYAIWGCNKVVLYALGLLLTIFCIVSFVVFASSLEDMKFGIAPFPHISGCYVVQTGHRSVFIAYVLIVIFETIVLSLTLYQCVKHFPVSNSTLSTVLYRDGILYYVYILAISVMNIVTVALPKQFYNLFSLQSIMHSIFAGYIIFHLRRTTANAELEIISDWGLETLHSPITGEPR